jgi:hypothetical protein
MRERSSGMTKAEVLEEIALAKEMAETLRFQMGPRNAERLIERLQAIRAWVERQR